MSRFNQGERVLVLAGLGAGLYGTILDCRFVAVANAVYDVKLDQPIEEFGWNARTGGETLSVIGIISCDEDDIRRIPPLVQLAQALDDEPEGPP